MSVLFCPQIEILNRLQRNISLTVSERAIRVTLNLPRGRGQPAKNDCLTIKKDELSEIFYRVNEGHYFNIGGI